MNYEKACKILDISGNFTQKQLKHCYYKLALKYHPDKKKVFNQDSSQNDLNFNDIQEAYTFLSSNKNLENSFWKENMYEKNENREKSTQSYNDILYNFVNSICKNFDADKIIELITNKYSKVTIEFLKTLPKSTILNLYNICNEYSDLLGISCDILNKINIVKELIKDDIVKIIYPSLHNLFNEEIYILNYNNENFYIPYWHHELIYDLSGHSLIVQCIPNLPDYCSIDKFNNLYIKVSTTISSLLDINYLNISIYEKSFKIPINELKIIKKQRYVIKNKGIPCINSNNIFNIDIKASIYIDITFTDIKL